LLIEPIESKKGSNGIRMKEYDRKRFAYFVERIEEMEKTEG